MAFSKRAINLMHCKAMRSVIKQPGSHVVMARVELKRLQRALLRIRQDRTYMAGVGNGSWK